MQKIQHIACYTIILLIFIIIEIVNKEKLLYIINSLNSTKAIHIISWWGTRADTRCFTKTEYPLNYFFCN